MIVRRGGGHGRGREIPQSSLLTAITTGRTFVIKSIEIGIGARIGFAFAKARFVARQVQIGLALLARGFVGPQERVVFGNRQNGKTFHESSCQVIAQRRGSHVQIGFSRHARPGQESGKIYVFAKFGRHVEAFARAQDRR